MCIRLFKWWLLSVKMSLLFEIDFLCLSAPEVISYDPVTFATDMWCVCSEWFFYFAISFSCSDEWKKLAHCDPNKLHTHSISDTRRRSLANLKKFVWIDCIFNTLFNLFCWSSSRIDIIVQSVLFIISFLIDFGLSVSPTHRIWLHIRESEWF